MFEIAELDERIDKDAYEAMLPQLRTDLLDAQYELIASRAFPVVLMFTGMEGTGVVEVLTRTYTVLDARHVVTCAFDEPNDEEISRPRLWRYWNALAPSGDIGVYTRAWYGKPLTERVLGRIDKAGFEQELERIARFETMLAAEGALILKFWLHISEAEQKKRLRKLRSSARTQWRVEDLRWGGSRRYNRVRRAAEQMIRHTGSANAPWITVNAANRYFRGISIMQTLLKALDGRLAQAPAAPAVAAPVSPSDIARRTRLSVLDLSLELERDDYRKQLAAYQERLNQLLEKKKFRKRSLVLVFEGNDAAGKGGSIRRVIEYLDPRRYRVNQIAAPSDEELAHPYLWRFWRRLPRHGDIAIFDRSWYGRVLVERVEGFCSEADWRRAYGEINDFEDALHEAGAIVVKFWLAIDQEEQARRFKAREDTGYKHYKITEDDWRNREKWDDYADAACDMFELTGTACAPWTLVEANNKYFARVKVLRTLCERLEKAL